LQSTHSTLSAELSDTGGGRGGGIFSNGTNITVVNSIFYKNLAVKGGGLYCIGYAGTDKDYKSPTMANDIFINNVAVRGGAIMGDVYCEFECDSCIFESNIASEKGGAIYLDYFCDISLNDTMFLSNVADESGGCIANDGFSIVLLSDNIMADNVAKWEGGCLYGGSHISDSGTIFYLQNPTFENNSAPYGFDDIWLWSYNGIEFLGDDSNQTIETTQTPGSTTAETTTPGSTTPETTTPGSTTETVAPTGPTEPSETIETTEGSQPPDTTRSEATTIFKSTYILFVFIISFCFVQI